MPTSFLGWGCLPGRALANLRNLKPRARRGEADRIFRIGLDPVRLFWSVRSVFWVSFWIGLTDQWYFGKKHRNQPKQIFILNFWPLWTCFEEETATSTPSVIQGNFDPPNESCVARWRRNPPINSCPPFYDPTSVSGGGAGAGGGRENVIRMRWTLGEEGES